MARRTDRAVSRLREIAGKRSKAEPSRPAGSSELCPPGYEAYGIDWSKLSPDLRRVVCRFADVLREIRQREVDLLKLAVDCNRAIITELQVMMSER